MNKIDKEWYLALRYLSRYTCKEIKEIQNKNNEEYKRNVPQHIEDLFHSINYIQFDEDYPQIVTQRGLQQLRDLEEIRRKDLTLIASVSAVIISLVALAKSMGWI